MPQRATSAPSNPQHVPIWDAPVRVVHALLILSFSGAWLTAEADGWRAVHISFGLSLAGLLVFRVLWGFLGSRPARFASFVRGPQAVAAHWRKLAAGTEEALPGHNPAGGWAVLGLLALGLLTALAGWLTYQGALGAGAIDPELLEDLHEGLATLMLGLVLLHVAAVILVSLITLENLPRSMVNGRKRAPASQAIQRPHRALAVLIVVVVLGFWAWGMGPASPFADAEQHARHDDD